MLKAGEMERNQQTRRAIVLKSPFQMAAWPVLGHDGVRG